MRVSGNAADIDLSVIVVNYNTQHLLQEMMASLQHAAEGLSLQVIVIDNASRDGSADYIRATWPDLELIANASNVGFGRANNQALPLLRGRNVLLLNTDAFVAPASLRIALANLDAHPDCGILGARLIGRDGCVQPSCRYFPTLWNILLDRTGLNRLFPGVQLVDDDDWNDREPAECDWVPGAFLLVRRAVIDQVGLFDPRYFLYYEEVDFCRAAKSAGWKVLYCPDISVVHIGGESAKSAGALTQSGRQLSALQIESELLYFRKHYGLAGVVAFLLFGFVGDALQAVKRLFRPKKNSGRAFSMTALACRLFARTRLGVQPTR
ncbi:MAG: glycosyltransferase family 2 protein [Pseudomonadota bacterium]